MRDRNRLDTGRHDDPLQQRRSEPACVGERPPRPVAMRFRGNTPSVSQNGALSGTQVSRTIRLRATRAIWASPFSTSAQWWTVSSPIAASTEPVSSGSASAHPCRQGAALAGRWRIITSDGSTASTFRPSARRSLSQRRRSPPKRRSPASAAWMTARNPRVRPAQLGIDCGPDIVVERHGLLPCACVPYRVHCSNRSSRLTVADRLIGQPSRSADRFIGSHALAPVHRQPVPRQMR